MKTLSVVDEHEGVYGSSFFTKEGQRLWYSILSSSVSADVLQTMDSSCRKEVSPEQP